MIDERWDIKKLGVRDDDDERWETMIMRDNIRMVIMMTMMMMMMRDEGLEMMLLRYER